MNAGITESTEESLILTLLDLANHLTRNGERLAQQEGLTAQQWLLLLQIAGDPNFPRLGAPAETGTAVLASNIAAARGVSRPTISALVSSLVHKGLVSQAEDPGDRRQKALDATPAGLAALDRIETGAATRQPGTARRLRSVGDLDRAAHPALLPRLTLVGGSERGRTTALRQWLRRGRCGGARPGSARRGARPDNGIRPV